MKRQIYECNGLVFESIVNLKKHQRDVKAAKADAMSTPIEGYDPGYPIVKAHEKAKAAALKSVKNEFSHQDDAKLENATVSTNYIKDEHYVEPSDGYLVVGVHMYMPKKKGVIGRFLTGSIGNWF